jgi:hypothetical protein
MASPSGRRSGAASAGASSPGIIPRGSERAAPRVAVGPTATRAAAVADSARNVGAAQRGTWGRGPAPPLRASNARGNDSDASKAPRSVRSLSGTSPNPHRWALGVLGAAEQTQADLDELDAKLSRLSPGAAESPARRSVRRPDAAPRPAAPLSWPQLRAQAETRLRERGVDPADCDLDSLLDPKEAERIERRALGGFELTCTLDRYDLLAAVAAGVVATAVDALVVRVPKDIRWENDQQRGSWLTGWLRDQSIESDNWLAKIAKVPYDAFKDKDGNPIPGMGPLTHRVQTFGHDPLIGLIVGTVDIMRGTVTGVSPKGLFVHDTNVDAVTNPFEALMLQVMHMFSDLPTRSGLPVPGWALISTITGVDYKDRSVSEWSRLMYLRGYDSWHFMTMATVPATVHLLLRAYWALRQELDPVYATQVAIETGPTGDAVSGHPRFDSLLLAGHAVAAGGNIAKLAAHGGNPVALNYNQWLAFFKAAFQRMSNPGPRSTEMLATRNYANASALADGWVDVARIDIATWPAD